MLKGLLARLWNPIAVIYLQACKERIRAFERFTGINNSQLKHSDVIKFVCEELKEERNKNIDLMNDRNQLRKLCDSMKSQHEYLLSRDALCSSMANTINKQAFEIAKMKGEYDK